MQLHSLQIQGFRKHSDSTIQFSDSTFLIGENNVGKSSVLHALNYLLGVNATIPEQEFYSVTENGEVKHIANEIILTAEFRNIPKEASLWRGFKGRILKYTPDKNDSNDSGLKFIYRKTYPLGGKVKIETLEYPRVLKEEFCDCKSINDYLAKGLAEDELSDSLQEINYDKKLTAKEYKLFEEIESIYDVDETRKQWVSNPGGIPQNVLVKLPRFLMIPAQDKEDEISGVSGTLQKTLAELFDEIKEESENYQEAKKYLNKLSKELDPKDDSTEISKMIKELNGIISEVFPNTGISAVPNLNDSIKPSFDIQMNSNISTSSKLQGTGLIRSTVFALLRYKALRDNRKSDNEKRELIIGFEEPEIYLHPNAICKMRDTIYNLAETGKNQIICTTHSPYMIDISRKPKQVLNSLYLINESCHAGRREKVGAIPFNITEEFMQLQEDDRNYIKMLLRVEDSIAKCFFVKNVLIIEGDTEQVVLSETIQRLPESIRTRILSEWYIVRARGKAAILPLIKYLKSMHINIFVMHDKDAETPGAVIFNKPIKELLADDSKLVVVENCIEDVLGYTAPSSDKPYKAYNYINENWKNWNSINESWRKIVEFIFNSGEKIEEVEEGAISV